MKILIGGDLVPTKSNEKLFSEGKIDTLLGNDLYDICKNADIRIFNLEVPLTDIEQPIPKRGPNLIASTNTIKGIKLINPTLLTLANNHILDQGNQGLESTQELLKKNNISSVGVGKDISQANKPYIINHKGVKIGIYACTTNEFTIATKNSMGANPFDPLESLDHIQDLSSKCDYVIVLYHGGKEHYRYPSPYLQKVCRKMSEKGADLVVCQHSHCIGAMEVYNESTIIYGQGNFLFDDSNSEFWRTSLLISIEFNDKVKIDFIPLYKDGNTVRLAKGSKGEEILVDFDLRSKNILQPGFIEQEYEKFALINKEYYLGSFAGFNRLSRKINSILNNKLIKYRYSDNKLMAIQNCIECEDHRELILYALKSKK